MKSDGYQIARPEPVEARCVQKIFHQKNTCESSLIEFMKNYYVYILASGKNGTLYIGVTNNLERRIDEHKGKVVDGFTKKYNISTLVYFESTDDVESAISREKALKMWKRQWKLSLIESINPNWNDLSLDFY